LSSVIFVVFVGPYRHSKVPSGIQCNALWLW